MDSTMVLTHIQFCKRFLNKNAATDLWGEGGSAWNPDLEHMSPENKKKALESMSSHEMQVLGARQVLNQVRALPLFSFPAPLQN